MICCFFSVAQNNLSSIRLSGSSKERIDYFNKNNEIKKNKYDIYDLSYVNISVYSGSKLVKKVVSGADGKFVLEFDIKQNTEYDIKYYKSGFYSKMSRFKTNQCENELIYSYEGWDVSLRKKVDGLREPTTLLPFEVYYYDSDEEEFSEDLDYTQNYDEVQKEIYADIEKEVKANDQFAQIRDKALRNLKAEMTGLANNENQRQKRVQKQTKKILSDARIEAAKIIQDARDSLNQILAENKIVKENPIVQKVYIDSSKTTITSTQKLTKIDQPEEITASNLNDASLQIQLGITELEAARKQLELDRLTAKTTEDSLLIQEREKELLRREGDIAKYATKVQEANNQIERQDYLLQTQRLYLYGSMGVLAIIVGFLFVVFWLFKQKQKVNGLLETQNKAIAEINNDIVSSIRYAQRIQTAILPPYEFMSKQFKKDYFVLYKPKDIVSGDFYWMDQREDKLLVTAVDCTGHGVPGAFMSMIGYNSLNKAVKEYGLTSPGDILNAQNKFVSESLRKSTNKKIRDGMDMSFIAIDYKKMTVQYAGAYNPLYIVRDGELMHIKGDNMAVGTYFQDPGREYTNHELDLKEGDCLYIFTDGYADQFGGPNYRKFMNRRLKEALIEISPETMSMQEKILWKRHKEWKGDEEQIDDICVIGIRI